jgi:hypothetical protein
MDKQLLDDAIGTAPPSTVDVEAIIGKQRRAARVRAVVNPRTAAVVGIVAVAGVVWALPGAAPGSDSAGPATMGAPAEPSCAEEARFALQHQFIGKAMAALPDGVVPADGEVGGLGGGASPSTPEVPRDLLFCGQGLGGGATVSSASGTGFLQVDISSATGNEKSPRTCAEYEQQKTDCVEDTGPDGEAVVAVTVGDSSHVSYDVFVTRPDSQRVLMLHCTSESPRSDPPLTMGQLVTVALDPALTEYLG